MSKPGYPATTPLSAALQLAAWATCHDHWPRYADCTGQPGLLWHTTYYKIFGVNQWSALLSLAQSLCACQGQLASNNGTRYKRCANAPDCTAMIVHEGSHIRYCAECHKRYQSFETSEVYTMGFVEMPDAPVRRSRWGIGVSDWDREALDL